MSQGLQILNKNHTVTLDLTSQLPKYVGEADIIPTSPNAACNGQIRLPSQMVRTWNNNYCVVDKVYTQIDLSTKGVSSKRYQTPNISLGSEYLYWRYIYYSENTFNLAVHVRFGCF